MRASIGLRFDGSSTNAPYSTVTDLARLRGWSTSVPRRTAMWYASSCNGIVDTTGAAMMPVAGSFTTWRPDMPCATVSSANRYSSPQRARAVLEFAGRVGLGVDVGDFLELERALHRHRPVRAAAEEQRVLLVDEVFAHRPNGRVELERLADQHWQMLELAHTVGVLVGVHAL